MGNRRYLKGWGGEIFEAYSRMKTGQGEAINEKPLECKTILSETHYYRSEGRRTGPIKENHWEIEEGGTKGKSNNKRPRVLTRTGPYAPISKSLGMPLEGMG